MLFFVFSGANIESFIEITKYFQEKNTNLTKKQHTLRLPCKISAFTRQPMTFCKANSLKTKQRGTGLTTSPSSLEMCYDKIQFAYDVRSIKDSD